MSAPGTLSPRPPSPLSRLSLVNRTMPESGRSAIEKAILFGAIGLLFTPWGPPSLTLPFCFGTLAFVVMKGSSARLVPIEVEDITTAEEHLKRAPRALRGDRVRRGA